MSIEKQAPEFMMPKRTYSDTLRFTPFAYAKLLWMRDRGTTEVAGYCITSTDDPFLITDFRLIKQESGVASFDLDPDDGAKFMEQMMDEGLVPWQYARILAHSHPGNSPQPSSTDETNFKKAFSSPDWAIMLIIAQDNSMYCRLKLNIGPGVEKLLKVEVDFSQDFVGSDHAAWNKEYMTKVTKQKFRMTGKDVLNRTINGIVVPNDIGCFPNENLPSANNPLWHNDEKEDRCIKLGQADPDLNYESQTCDLDDTGCFWDVNGNVAYWDDEKEAWFYYDPIEEAWYTDDKDDEIVAVTPPNEYWVTQVVLWANEYADERDLTVEETL